MAKVYVALLQRGTTELDGVEEINASSDQIVAKGLVFEDDAGIKFELVDNEIAYKDTQQVTLKKLNDLAGITIPEHRSLDQLVHRLAEDSYTEITRTSGKVTNITVWTDSGKTLKIREVDITRVGGLVSQTVTKQYDEVGSLAETYTNTFTRTGSKITSIDGVLT